MQLAAGVAEDIPAYPNCYMPEPEPVDQVLLPMALFASQCKTTVMSVGTPRNALHLYQT